MLWQVYTTEQAALFHHIEWEITIPVEQCGTGRRRHSMQELRCVRRARGSEKVRGKKESEKINAHWLWKLEYILIKEIIKKNFD
jgi:hypothetical protein